MNSNLTLLMSIEEVPFDLIALSAELWIAILAFLNPDDLSRVWNTKNKRLMQAIARVTFDHHIDSWFTAQLALARHVNHMPTIKSILSDFVYTDTIIRNGKATFIFDDAVIILMRKFYSNLQKSSLPLNKKLTGLREVSYFLGQVLGDDEFYNALIVHPEVYFNSRAIINLHINNMSHAHVQHLQGALPAYSTATPRTAADIRFLAIHLQLLPYKKDLIETSSRNHYFISFLEHHVSTFPSNYIKALSKHYILLLQQYTFSPWDLSALNIILPQIGDSERRETFKLLINLLRTNKLSYNHRCYVHLLINIFNTLLPQLSSAEISELGLAIKPFLGSEYAQRFLLLLKNLFYYLDSDTIKTMAYDCLNLFWNIYYTALETKYLGVLAPNVQALELLIQVSTLLNYESDKDLIDRIYQCTITVFNDCDAGKHNYPQFLATVCKAYWDNVFQDFSEEDIIPGENRNLINPRRFSIHCILFVSVAPYLSPDAVKDIFEKIIFCLRLVKPKYHEEIFLIILRYPSHPLKEVPEQFLDCFIEYLKKDSKSSINTSDFEKIFSTIDKRLVTFILSKIMNIVFTAPNSALTAAGITLLSMHPSLISPETLNYLKSAGINRSFFKTPYVRQIILAIQPQLDRETTVEFMKLIGILLGINDFELNAFAEEFFIACQIKYPDLEIQSIIPGQSLRIEKSTAVVRDWIKKIHYKFFPASTDVTLKRNKPDNAEVLEDTTAKFPRSGM